VYWFDGAGLVLVYFDFRGDWIFFSVFGFGSSGDAYEQPMQAIPLPFQTRRQEHFGQVDRRVDIVPVSSARAGPLPQ
jgi:hypothetical protein